MSSGTPADAAAVGGGAVVFGMMTMAELQTGLAVAVGLLTVVVLVQRVWLQWRDIQRGFSFKRRDDG